MNAIALAQVSECVPAIRHLATLIHIANVNAGWWTDLKTGTEFRCVGHGNLNDPLSPQRNAGEMLALIHSEISEALEGVRKGLMDDKLPNRRMEEVEMADTIIRILDYCGGRDLDVAGAILEKLEYNAHREDHKVENRKAGGKQI